MFIVYIIVNKINGKIYIGQTTKNNPNYMGSGKIIMRSIKKYGRKNFVKIILETCHNQNHMNEREIYWIKFYDSTNRDKGYNISKGGNGGNLGSLVNQKLSMRSKNQVVVKDKNGNIFRINKNDPRFLKGELVGVCKGIMAYNKGIPMSEEQKEKLRKPKSKEHRMAMSKSRIGKHTKKIICINNGIIYTSIKLAAEQLNLTVPNVVAVLKGRASKTKGFSFKYFS